MTCPFTIVMYLPTLASGGAEKLVLRLANHFVKAGHAVTILLDRMEGSLLAEVPSQVRLSALDSSRTLVSLPRLAQYLRREKPDVVLSHLGHNNIIAAWAAVLAGGTTRVYMCQHSMLTEESAASGKWQHWLLPMLYRLTVKRAAGVVAVSQSVAADLARRACIPPTRVSVIYNPVVCENFFRLAQDPVSHPWLSGAIKRVFVAVGRLSPDKDYPTLLKGLASLGPSSGARLMILGEGEQRSELEALAEALGVADRIAFLGFQDNPLPFMREAAALILTSRYEGFGNVLVEAMACGTAVISTDCPGGPAEILEGGRYGALIPVGDASAVSRAMLDVLQNVRPSARHLKERASLFSVERSAEKYLDLIATPRI